MMTTRITPWLVLAACGVEPSTEVATSELSEYQWNDDVQIPNQMSERQPALAYLDGQLHMIHSGNSNPDELYWSKFNGINTWTANTKLAWKAERSVGLATYNGELVMVYQPAGQNRLVMQTSSGSFWSDPGTAGSALGTHTLRSAPSLAVHNGYLYAAYCVDTRRIQVDRFDGTVWTQATYFSVPTSPYYPTTCEHVAIASLPDNGRLDMIYTQALWNTSGVVFAQYMYERTATGTTSLSVSPETAMGMHSEKPLSIVSCIEPTGHLITHLTHGGETTPREIWWSYRSNGAWVTNLRIPDQASEGGTALGCYAGNETIMVHNGGTNQLWWSELYP